jgi:hypothetical protein
MRRAHQLQFTCAAFVIMSLVFPLCSAQAALTFDMGFQFNGDGTMYGAGPWLNITLVDVSADTVDLTISAVGLMGSEKVAGVYLNLDPLLNPALLAFSAPTKTGNLEDPTISHAVADSYKADGDGLYDILIEFNEDGPAKAFNGGDAVKYTISLTSLLASSFDFESADAPGMETGPFKVATHFKSPGDVSGTSVWATPEPATICLLGLGALSLLKKRKA